MTKRPTPEIVSDYLHWREHSRGMRPNTLGRDHHVLTLTSESLDLEIATLADLDAWWLSRSNRKPGTRNADLAVLRSFYKWAVAYDRVPADPTRRLHHLRGSSPAVNPVTEDELRTVLHLLRREPELKRFVVLMAYAGLREAEAVNVQWRDLDQHTRRLLVTDGKGGKQRLTALAPEALELLGERGDPTSYVVTSSDFRAVPHSLAGKLRRRMRYVGVDKTCHDFRKRFASIVGDRLQDPFPLKQFMGWSSVDSAVAYINVSADKLDQIARAAW